MAPLTVLTGGIWRTSRDALAVVLLAIVLCCVHFEPVAAESTTATESCDHMLLDHSNIAFPFFPYVSCLNNTKVNTTLASEFLYTIWTGAQMHSLGPTIPKLIDDVLSVSWVGTPSLFGVFLRVERALRAARDPHFAVYGNTFFDSLYVVRMLVFSVRTPTADPLADPTGADGEQIELYVSEVYPESVISYYTESRRLRTQPVQMPDAEAFAATFNKTVRTINGEDAMLWVRRQANLSGYMPPNGRMNLLLLSGFMTRLTEAVYDLWSPTERVVFSDGSSIEYPRIVLKRAARTVSYRCENAGATTSDRVDALLRAESEDTTIRHLAEAGHVVRHVSHAAGQPHVLVRGRTVEDDADVYADDEPVGNTGKRRKTATATPGSESFRGAIRGSSVLYTYQLQRFLIATIRQAGAVKFAAWHVPQMFFPIERLTSDLINQLESDINDFITECDNQGVEELVIDVASNPGGYVFLQNILLRMLDGTYNVQWDGLSSAAIPPITPDDKTLIWVRTYLRRDAQQGPLGGYYPWMLRGSNLENPVWQADGSAAPSGPTSVWWGSVGETEDGFTPVYTRPALFQVNAVHRPFRRIKILSDALCGSACCMLIERLKRYGMQGASIEFIGFGGDPAAPSFQMSDFCGGSVFRLCSAMRYSGVTTHPFLTGSGPDVNLDITFVSTAMYANRTSNVPSQYDMLGFATRVIRNWRAISNSAAAHEERLEVLFGRSVRRQLAMAPAYPQASSAHGRGTAAAAAMAVTLLMSVMWLTLP